MPDDILPQCILLIFYTLFGAFFSAGETALSYCNNVRIRLMADNGDKRARKVVRLLDHFDETVVALLIGVNILHVVSAAAATVLFVSVWGNAGATISTVVMTLVVFIFGETIPKNIAKANADGFILGTAAFILWFFYLFKPAVFVLTHLGEFCKSLIKVKEEPSMTDDEFATIVDSVQSEGLLEESETDIIKSSINFYDLLAKQVMTPREKIVSLPLTATQDEVRACILSSPFSRYPITDGDNDHIVGVLVARKVLFALAHGQQVDVKTMMDKPVKIPMDKSVADAFQEMRTHKMHFAVLQDGNGKTVGVITMDDILKELVDDIEDIHEELPVKKPARSAKPGEGGGKNG